MLDTLQQLARYHREQLDIPFVGITGTNGKTTTKELVATVLSKKYRVHYTQGNFNNHIGVPLTLLSIKPDCEIAVIEMGANHPGEIKTLANIALPTCGLITNVGKAHLEGFGSLEGVINTKKELYDNLVERSGHVFVNAANPYLTNIINDFQLSTFNFQLKIMPYRRLPKTDQARLKSLKKAIAMEKMPMNEIPVPFRLLTQANAYLPVFETLVSQYNMTFETQVTESKKYQNMLKNAPEQKDGAYKVPKTFN